MEDWAEIRRLHKAVGLSIKEVARLTGVVRNTVRSALRSDTPPAPGEGRVLVSLCEHRQLSDEPCK